MLPSSERVKDTFIPSQLEKARVRTWEAVRAIAAKMEIGMLEADARILAEDTLKQMGAERYWHRTHVRFGVNTLQTFSDTSLPGVRLQPRDLFFLDIGPVWEGYEGDCGQTFVVGDDPEMVRCAADSKALFEIVKQRWFETSESGQRLYAFAQEQAAARGWQFILRGASGHRLSDFPHVLYHKGTLHAFDGRPSEARWVLEIQLRHPKRQFGAFYEDLLV